MIKPDQQTQQFLDDILAELTRARSKFPAPNPNLAALSEEAGEVAKAILGEPSRNIYKEAVQLATMAIRIALEGDPTLDEYRSARGLDQHPATPFQVIQYNKVERAVELTDLQPGKKFKLVHQPGKGAKIIYASKLYPYFIDYHLFNLDDANQALGALVNRTLEHVSPSSVFRFIQ